MNTQKPIDHLAIRQKAAALAIEKLGGATAGAMQVGAPSRQTVESWMTRGVPAIYCMRVHALTGIPLQDLRSGDWQNYWPKSN